MKKRSLTPATAPLMIVVDLSVPPIFVLGGKSVPERNDVDHRKDRQIRDVEVANHARYC